MKSKSALLQFCAIFLILVFFPFPSSVIGYSKSLYINEAFLLLFIAYLFLKNNYRLYFNNTMYLLLLIIGANFCTIMVALLSGRLQFNLVSEIFRVIEWIVLYQFFYNWINRNNYKTLSLGIEKTYKIMYFILIPFFIIEFFDMSLKNILKVLYCMSKSGSYFSTYSRITGPFRNPNFCAACIAIFMVGVLMSQCNKFYKIFIALASSLIIYYTGSRTGLVAFVVILVVAYASKLICEKNKKLTFKILILALLFLIILNYLPIEKLTLYKSRIFDFRKVLETFGGRTNIWIQALEAFKDHMVFGVDGGNDIVYDNLYIQLLVQHGIIGFLLYGSFFAKNIWKVWKFVKVSKSNLSYFCISVQIVMFVLGITMQVFDVLQITTWYFFTLACVDTAECVKNSATNNYIINE